MAGESFHPQNPDPSAFTKENLGTVLSNQNLPGEYLIPDTEIKYRGTAYTIEYDSGCVKIELSGEEDYECPRIMYYPSESNVIGTLANPLDIRVLPEMVYQLASEFMKANISRAGEVRELFGGYKIEFDPDSKTSYVIDKDYKTRVPLFQASSGLQSLTPLVVVSDYFFSSLEGDYLDRLKRESYLIRDDILERVKDRELRGKLEAFFASNLKNTFSSGEVEKIRFSVDGLVNSSLIQIVEEPEQNLYPSSQVEMLMKLVSNTTENGKLVMTTHSPYILSVVENYNYAYDQYIQFGKTIEEVPKRLFMPFECVEAYKMENGRIRSIMDAEARMVDGSEIDGCSSFINSVFDKIYKLGEESEA